MSGAKTAQLSHTSGNKQPSGPMRLSINNCIRAISAANGPRRDPVSTRAPPWASIASDKAIETTLNEQNIDEIGAHQT